MPAHKSADVAILTVIPPELHAAQEALGPLQRDAREDLNDTIFLQGSVRSELRQRDYSVVLAAIGSAGTASAASVATQVIERYRPRMLLLVGIAAGMRDKVRIGEVVLSERVVAYEPAAATVGADGAPLLNRRTETKEEEWARHVVSSVSLKTHVTIASGDKLLRDPSVLRGMRRDIHGKTSGAGGSRARFSKRLETRARYRFLD